MIDIYTDGSCIGNPGPGGWGVIILTNEKKLIIKGHDPATTNNRMEMQAVIAALQWLQKESRHQKIKFHCDSNLIVQTLTQGWKKKANTDLWQMIDERLNGLDISWKWVKAHAQNALNNEVDAIAFSEARIAGKKIKSQITT